MRPLWASKLVQQGLAQVQQVGQPLVAQQQCQVRFVNWKPVLG
jgi:hypothetical protein